MGLTVLPADREGRIAYEDFPAALRGNTRAVVCTHASNVTGNGLDLARIGAFCRAHGLLFVVDASQSAGVLDIDMQAQNIAVLCFTGHKGLFGPQGTGGLCVAPGVDVRPRRVGGSGVHSFDRHHPGDYPERLEAGTLNAAGIAGLSAGLDFIEQTGLAAIRAREAALARRFYQGIHGLPGVVTYGDMDAPLRTAVVAMNFCRRGRGRGRRRPGPGLRHLYARRRALRAAHARSARHGPAGHRALFLLVLQHRGRGRYRRARRARVGRRMRRERLC